MSHVTRHTPHVTHHTSLVIRHSSHLNQVRGSMAVAHHDVPDNGSTEVQPNPPPHPTPPTTPLFRSSSTSATTLISTQRACVSNAPPLPPVPSHCPPPTPLCPHSPAASEDTLSSLPLATTTQVTRARLCKLHAPLDVALFHCAPAVCCS